LLSLERTFKSASLKRVALRDGIQAEVSTCAESRAIHTEESG
jgi:hypothetical protein